MARTKGTFTVAGNFEVKAGKLLDARCFVADKAALKAQDTWVVDGINYLTEGLTVYVKSEKAVYTYTNPDPAGFASDANWKKLTDQKPTVATSVSSSTNPVSAQAVQNEFGKLLLGNSLNIGTGTESFEGKFYAFNKNVLSANEDLIIGTTVTFIADYFKNRISEIHERLGLHENKPVKKVPIRVGFGDVTSSGNLDLVHYFKDAFVSISTVKVGSISDEQRKIISDMNITNLGTDPNAVISLTEFEIETPEYNKIVTVLGTNDNGSAGGTQSIRNIKKGIFIQ